MYETSFSLSRRPFSAAPDAQDFVAVGSVEAARESAIRCIGRSAGSVLVVGSPGTGKTLLCEVLENEFAPEMQVATLCSAQLCTRRALLQAILFELNLPYKEREEGELRLSLIDHLTNTERCPNGMLLMVDEAHTLPLRLLEEIRMITNLVREGESRVRLLMAGTSSLEERLASPKLESLNQRVAARCYLDAMNREETDHYVRAQIQRAGGDAETFFPAEARSAVYNATLGIPRLVNQVCDHSLIMAVAGGHECVTAAVVEESWADLQQLPTPWLDNAPGLQGNPVHEIEFGSLDDEESTDAIPATTSEPVTFDLVGDTEEIASQIETPHEELVVEKNEPMVDPVDQIDQLESAIADLQADSIEVTNTAEVQLIFHGGHDPFGEDFDQEEDVVDQYSAMDELQRLKLPKVTSDEGQAIDVLLTKAKTQETPAETVGAAQSGQGLLADENTCDEASSSDLAAAASSAAESASPEIGVGEPESLAIAEQESLSKAVIDFLGDGDAQRQQIDTTASEEQVVVSIDVSSPDAIEAESKDAAAAVELQMSLQTEVDELVEAGDDDRDLIIIDHAGSFGEAAQETEVTKPSKRKYSQLFARLRQA